MISARSSPRKTENKSTEPATMTPLQLGKERIEERMEEEVTTRTNTSSSGGSGGAEESDNGENDQLSLLKAPSSSSKNWAQEMEAGKVSSLGVISVGSSYKTVDWKTITVALLLFCAGISFFVTGGVLLWHTGAQDGVSLLVIGSIMILPGSYGVVIVYGSCKRWEGYDRESVERSLS